MSKEKLAFMQEHELRPELMVCPNCGEEKRIGIHSKKDRRLICHACKKTFSETKGTVLYGLHYPIWVVVLVLTLLAHGCPVPAIVAAFMLDERTVRTWLERAGMHGMWIQETVVCNGKVDSSHIQADELCLRTQLGKVWMATAMCVRSRLWIWGEVSPNRDTALITRLFGKVRQALSGMQPVLIATDGFAAYPNVILKTFRQKVLTGRRGRPRLIPWNNLQIVQVVKSFGGKTLTPITHRIVHGSKQAVDALITFSQSASGTINTAFIERLNATFRSRMPSLVRRTRSLARTQDRLLAEMFWSGVVYNFATLHDSLGYKTPAMVAGLSSRLCSVEDLLFFKPHHKSLHSIF